MNQLQFPVESVNRIKEEFVFAYRYLMFLHAKEFTNGQEPWGKLREYYYELIGTLGVDENEVLKFDKGGDYSFTLKNVFRVNYVRQFKTFHVKLQKGSYRLSIAEHSQWLENTDISFINIFENTIQECLLKIKETDTKIRNYPTFKREEEETKQLLLRQKNEKEKEEMKAYFIEYFKKQNQLT